MHGQAARQGNRRRPSRLGIEDEVLEAVRIVTNLSRQRSDTAFRSMPTGRTEKPLPPMSSARAIRDFSNAAPPSPVGGSPVRAWRQPRGERSAGPLVGLTRTGLHLTTDLLGVTLGTSGGLERMDLLWCFDRVSA